ncbi:uncharacterized protein BROUX77_006186 [Berkeleyomyces rouxiae]|uniref:uncharacterized protein n=1 Tax=Berkeleyomyces rouxiae TaxID=2035830 RepID=UPI003B79723B
MAASTSSHDEIVTEGGSAATEVSRNESKQSAGQQEKRQERRQTQQEPAQQQVQNGQLPCASAAGPISASSPSSPPPPPHSSSSSFSPSSSPSPSSSRSHQIKTRALLAYPARIIQKASRKVISVFSSGKPDAASAPQNSPPPGDSDVQPAETMASTGGLTNVTNSPMAVSRLANGVQALGLQENSPPLAADVSDANDMAAAAAAGGAACSDDALETQSARLSFAGSAHSFAPLRPLVPLGEAGRPTRTPEEDAVHEGFTQAALEMARLALRTNETPVGCVLVHDGKVIAKGMNATNVTRNGTRHAEFMAVCSLLGQPSQPGADVSFASAAKTARAFHETNQARKASEAAAVAAAILAADTNYDARSVTSTTPSISSVSPSVASSSGQTAAGATARVKVEHEGVSEDVVSKSYLYPYGQKWWPEAKFNPDIFHECTLYVTVEPCVMCASFLRQLGIRKVFFGAVNDKFGGTGGVFNIHKNCQKLDAAQLAQGTDGGPVGRGFDVEGGWGRDEAVALLRRFYVQENGRAPVPRKKEGRAARLATLEQVNGITVGEMDAGMISSLDENASGGGPMMTMTSSA